MFKTFTVLFVLGLALGIWLGFNPQAREKRTAVGTKQKPSL